MAEKIITKIPQRIKPLSGVPLQGRTRRKVAGYARVSTDSEEQENSYEAQVGYFTDYIRTNPEWEFVKIYTEEEPSNPALFIYADMPDITRMTGISVIFR